MAEEAFDLICRLTGGDSIQTTSLLNKVCDNESGLVCDKEISVLILLNSIKMVQQVYIKQSFVNTRDEIYSLLIRLGKTKSTQEPVQNSVHGLEAPSQLVGKQLIEREPVQNYDLLALSNQKSSNKHKTHGHDGTHLASNETTLNSNDGNQGSDEMVTSDFEEAQPNPQSINESRPENTQFGAQESTSSAFTLRSNIANVQANKETTKVLFITEYIALPDNLIRFMEITGCTRINRSFKNKSKVVHYIYEMTNDAIERIDPLIEGHKIMVIPIGWHRAEIKVENSNRNKIKEAFPSNVLISNSYKKDTYNITTDCGSRYNQVKRTTVNSVKPDPRAKYKLCDKCLTAYDCYHKC